MNHVYEWHNEAYDYPCDVCDRVFKTEGAKKRHNRAVHYKPRPKPEPEPEPRLPCRFPPCDETFADDSARGKHEVCEHVR